jgi:SPW repeat
MARFVPAHFHGFFDYFMGVLLIAAPWLFGFHRGGAETWVMVVLGAAIIVYSLLTDYDLGISRRFPIATRLHLDTHLWLDGLAGLLLFFSPWLFGFADIIVAPHVILGLVELGAALLTAYPTRRRITTV